VLLVDHGSRLAEANRLLDVVARQVEERLPGRLVASAHLELATPGVPEAIDRLAAAGAQDILVVPWFLAPGRHTTRDIPRLVAEAVERHPALTLRVAAPLAPHPALVEVTLARIEETGG
jgi:sirohydrochlorin ferrochelatase